MTNPVFAGNEPARHIAVADLQLSPLNPRTNIDTGEIENLAASIEAVGLMQNLAGYERQPGQIEIVAGGRRLRALKLIDARNGGKTTAPVIVTDDEATARFWAATENQVRRALNPADEIRAFRQMAQTGADAAKIANAFATTTRHVKGRMRMADLPEPILDALGTGQINLDAAAAYTLSDDPDAQMNAFESLSDWQKNDPFRIRAFLSREQVRETDGIARFVGRSAYEAAGGNVREDLFGEDVYFTDGDVIRQLAIEKLKNEAIIHETAGWKWVETRLDRPQWEELQNFVHTYPMRIAPAQGEAERYDELAGLIENETASEEERAEFDALEQHLERDEFSDEQMAHAGVILWIDHAGDLRGEYGLVREEDQDAAQAAGVIKNAKTKTAAKPQAKPTYSQALSDDIRRIRTGAVQAALLEKPELALDLLTFALSTAACGGIVPLGLRTENGRKGPSTARMAGLM